MTECVTWLLHGNESYLTAVLPELMTKILIAATKFHLSGEWVTSKQSDLVRFKALTFDDFLLDIVELNSDVCQDFLLEFLKVAFAAVAMG